MKNELSQLVNKTCKLTAILLVSIPCGFYLCVFLQRIFS